MMRFIYILICLLLTLNTQGQAQDTIRQRDWPVGVPMDDENIEWRQDIYRELNLTDGRNAGLYSPSSQEDGTVGLFAKILELAIQRQINIYKFEIEGNERMTQRNRTDIKNILSDFHINYQSKGDTLIINKSDIPYAEVTTYYLKEAVYYDVINSTFSTRVMALCPVIVMEDELSEEPVRYPLFWVKYADLEKYLHEIYTIPDYRNIAGRMPMDEYFALNLYSGEIYKTYNAYGNTLGMTLKNDTALQKERQRIEENMKRVRNNTYNIYYREREKELQQKENTPDKEKTKYKWIFPWQKKKMLKAAEEQRKSTSEEEKTENSINNIQ